MYIYIYINGTASPFKALLYSGEYKLTTPVSLSLSLSVSIL